jgi:N-acetylmuramoyl-L-alanine amidase-like protein
MIQWYPAATVVNGNDAGDYTGGPFKGVLHTTEGGTAAGAISAYRKNNSWPHFTVDKDGKVYQHVPIDKAARSLVNLSGGVQTNRDSAIQIEVVGRANNPVWPLIQVENLRILMRWIESQTLIQQSGPVFHDQQHVVRFTQQQWDNFNGWCGHQHVPENTHWDPGAIDLSELLPEVTPVPDPIVIPNVNAPVVGIAVTPSGLGYYLVCADGGVFTFGDAVYRGRVDYVLPAGNDWTPAQ